MKQTYFIGIKCYKAKPTQNHRMAMWECMLGTVYAMNEKGKVEYFDYDWEKAKAFAGIKDKKDIRVWRNPWSFPYESDKPARGKLVLYVEKK